MPQPSSGSAHLFAVTAEGARPLPIPRATDDLHAVLDDAPLGVYEGFRTWDHTRFLRLSRHFARARRSLELADLHTDIDEAMIRRALQQAAESWPGTDSRFRLDFLSGPAHALGHDGEVVFVQSDMPAAPAGWFESGVRIGLARGLHRERPLAKEARWVLERRAATGDFYESLLVDEDERALECTSSNFFVIRDGVLLTAGDGVLKGVTRGIVLEVAAEAGLRVEMTRADLSETDRWEEAFLTSASRTLIPITAIDGQPIGVGHPGPVWRKLREVFLKHVSRITRPAWPLTEAP